MFKARTIRKRTDSYAKRANRFCKRLDKALLCRADRGKYSLTIDENTESKVLLEIVDIYPAIVDDLFDAGYTLEWDMRPEAILYGTWYFKILW